MKILKQIKKEFYDSNMYYEDFPIFLEAKINQIIDELKDFQNVEIDPKIYRGYEKYRIEIAKYKKKFNA